MTQNEFDLTKRICQASEQCVTSELDCEEFPNIRDRILDGANIVDLYMEFKGYIYTNFGHLRPENEDKRIELEDQFWNAAAEVIVDKVEQHKDTDAPELSRNGVQQHYVSLIHNLVKDKYDDYADIANWAAALEKYKMNLLSIDAGVLINEQWYSKAMGDWK